MVNIDISLYYHLRIKAGVGTVSLSIPTGTTIKEVKQILEEKFPALLSAHFCAWSGQTDRPFYGTLPAQPAD